MTLESIANECLMVLHHQFRLSDVPFDTRPALANECFAHVSDWGLSIIVSTGEKYRAEMLVSGVGCIMVWLCRPKGKETIDHYSEREIVPAMRELAMKVTAAAHARQEHSDQSVASTEFALLIEIRDLLKSIDKRLTESRML